MDEMHRTEKVANSSILTETLEQLRESVNATETRIDMLRGRLDPVMKPAPESAGGQCLSHEPDGAVSTTVAMLVNQVGRLGWIADEVDQIMLRLDV